MISTPRPWFRFLNSLGAAKRQLAIEEAVRIASDVATALAYTHSLGGILLVDDAVAVEAGPQETVAMPPRPSSRSIV